MSENIAFSNRSYKINDNQWIESLSRRSNTSTWRKKIIFTTNTHAHTKHTLQDQQQQRQKREERKKETMQHYWILNEKSIWKKIQHQMCSAYKWPNGKQLLLLEPNSVAATFTQTHRHTQNIAGKNSNSRKFLWSARFCGLKLISLLSLYHTPFYSCHFISFCFVLLSVSVLCMYDTIGP